MRNREAGITVLARSLGRLPWRERGPHRGSTQKGADGIYPGKPIIYFYLSTLILFDLTSCILTTCSRLLWSPVGHELLSDNSSYC